jgi:hypothetical protein
MQTTTQARRVIESIQRNYYLHPDDVTMREQDPDGMESLRQGQTIKRYEGMLELYVPMYLISYPIQGLIAALH